MSGLRTIHCPSRRLAWGGHLYSSGLQCQLNTARSDTCTVPSAQPKDSTSSAEPADATAPGPVKDKSSGLLNVFGAMAAVLVVVAAFYSVAFFAGSAFLFQFKDQIASVTKKDFVPYSERRAMERQLLEERMQAGSPDVQDTAKALERGIDRDFINLLPLE